MPENKVSTKRISFRAQIQGEIADFLRDEKMGCDATTEGLAELIGSLAHYQEEGERLFPEIFVCDDAKEVLRVVQGSELIAIGTGTRASGTIVAALKRCAPLAEDGWAVYIERQPNAFSYGMLRLSSHPLSLTSAEGVSAPESAEFHVLLVSLLAPNVVEIRSSSNKSLEIQLSSARAEAFSPNRGLYNLTSTICSDIVGDLGEETERFLRKTLSRALRRCHGTIIAVIRNMENETAALLSDNIRLEPPLDFRQRVADFKLARGVEEIAALHSAASLLGRIINNDGVTVFSTDAKVLAYRVFIQSTGGNLASGGARNRAFQSLRSRCGKEIISAFFLSQDGNNDFCGIDDHGQ
jgi:hypothetical protein